MKILTLARLRKAGACYYALMRFEEKFNSKAQISKVYYELTHPEPGGGFVKPYQDWLIWLLAQDKELTIVLFEQGADVNAVDRDNWTSLHWAARNNNTKMVRFLLKQGADVNAVDDSGRTPVYWARKFLNTEMIELLESKGVK